MHTLTHTANDATTALSHGGAAGSTRLLRLWLVELRKLVDTRAGIALLVLAAVLAGAFGGGLLLFTEIVTLDRIARMAAIPATVLLPVMAALLATAERQHRTALTSYVLTPRRGLVLAAKASAVVTLALAAWALSIAAALIIAPVGSVLTGNQVTGGIDWPSQLWLGLGLVLAALSGFAVGLISGSAPVAISILLAWPVLATFLGIVPQIAAVLPWLDLGSLAGFTDGITSLEVFQVCTAVVAWGLLPGAAGVLRELRTEVR